MFKRFIFVVGVLIPFFATSVSAEVSLTDRQASRASNRSGKEKVQGGAARDGTARSTTRGVGDVTLIDASRLVWFLNTDITFTTSSSASGAMQEASYTQAVMADTIMGGTTSSVLDDAFDGYNGLFVNGVSYNINGPGGMDASGRQYVFNPQTIGNLSVSRKVFVPDNDSFARWLNIITNNGASMENVTVMTSNNLGSDGRTVVVETSDGDTTAEVTDTWVVTFQDWLAGKSSDPRLAHVLQPGARVEVGLSAISFVDGDDGPFWEYNFDLDPGETAIIMNLATGQPTIAAALAKAAELADLPDNALEFMTDDELDQVVNFETPECDSDGFARLCLSRGDYISGEALTVDLSVENQLPSPVSGGVTGRHLGFPAVGDFYFGVLLPDQNTIVFFRDPSLSTFGIGTLSDLSTLSPMVAGVDLDVPFSVDIDNFFSRVWIGLEPPGTYLVFLAGVVPGAFADGSADPGDIFSLVLVPFSFTP